MVVASPVDSDTTAFTGRALAPTLKNAKKLIADLMDGKTTLSTSVLDPDRLLREPGRANCYGPSMKYTNHPDGSPDNSPLPGGDLGIWTDTEGSTTEACTAAQLNARMKATRDKVMTGMVGLAALIRVYETSTGNNWPDDIAVGDSEDLVAALNALSLPNFTFTKASISHDGTDSALWSYQLAFDFDDGSRQASVDLGLTHRIASAATGEVEGVMTYKIDRPNTGGNCNAGTYPKVTEMGSVHYIRDSAGDLSIKNQSATACGDLSTATNLLNTTLTDVETSSALTNARILDPSQDWKDNYNLFIADFTPDTGVGKYLYAWQAGSGDSHTRLLMLNLSADAQTGALYGTSYFGFGDRVQTSTKPTFKGMICNWAGPGNNHNTLFDGVQRQAIRQNLTSNLFELDSTVTDNSDITYAPTNSCTYYPASGFDYDRDLDGTLDGSDKVEVDDPAPFDGLALDLFRKGS
ncbi:MAG: hypothetical protein D6758_03530, partial [Gammaproteobacteria bacterium]